MYVVYPKLIRCYVLRKSFFFRSPIDIYINGFVGHPILIFVALFVLLILLLQVR